MRSSTRKCRHGVQEVVCFDCCMNDYSEVEAHAAVVAVLRHLQTGRGFFVRPLCDDLDRLAGRPVGTLLKEVRNDG